jgi:DNA-binding transcriptional regulator YiaG
MALTVSPGIQNTDCSFLPCNRFIEYSRFCAVTTSIAFSISEEIVLVHPQRILFNNLSEGLFIENVQHKNEKTLDLECSPDLVLMRAIKILGISISDIALILGVSRPTVYSYKNKLSFPEGIIKEKLELLDSALCQIEKKCPDVPFESMLKRKDLKGTSLFDLLQNNQSVGDYVGMLCKVAKQEEVTRQTLRQQYAEKRNINSIREGNSLSSSME